MALLMTTAAIAELSHLSTEWQIATYSSAAPEPLASGATVLGVDQSVLREGSNGWTCMPANPRGYADPTVGWVDAHDAMPICTDTEGMK